MATRDTHVDVLDERADVDRSGEPRRSDGGIGIDHLTVIPENFDPTTGTVEQ